MSLKRSPARYRTSPPISCTATIKCIERKKPPESGASLVWH